MGICTSSNSYKQNDSEETPSCQQKEQHEEKAEDAPSFQNEQTHSAEACDQDGDDPIEGCVKLKRLIALLTRYSQLDIEKNTDDKETFIALFGGDYTQCLDDYAHLVNEHHNLEAINKAVKANELFGKCDVTKCHFTARHQTRESTNTKVMTDHRVNFYSQLLDSFHFYLMHLFECGMRTETNDIDQKGDEDEQMDDDNQYFDARFARISRAINQRQHIRLAFARFKTNNKFNIQAATATGGSSNTVYMDEAVRCLLYSNAHEETIRNFAELIAFHQYDSESMKEDIRHASQGNIAVNIGDEEVVKALDEFIQAAELRSSSFNIGLTFYYWPEYEKMDAFDANTHKFNINDHG
eukprot:826319_1